MKEFSGKQTVQQYIDETPKWNDGTAVATTPLTVMQWRIWWLATAGKFFEGMVVFMTGVALPLMVLEFGLDAMGKGMVGAAPLFGILIGATLLGGLSDHYGRRGMFIAEMGLFLLFLVGVSVSNSFPVLLFCLFGMGMALGCDYPTAHLVISESIPSNFRGKLVLGAFGFQALGALAGTAAGYFILRGNESLSDWRWMYAMAILPALAVFLGRFFIPQSGHWLMVRDRVRDAENATMALLQRAPQYPKSVVLKHADEDSATKADKKPGFHKLFKKKHLRGTILASVPWFLQDLSTYGIGIFTPTILAATIGVGEGKSRHNLSAVIYDDMLAAKGAALIDILLIVGIFTAIFFVDKIGRIWLQVLGFIGCAFGLAVAALSSHFTGDTKLAMVFAGFMIFSFMTNAGPNAMTYLIAGEVFPTNIRGMGAGFAASFAKIGAVLTAFLFPIFLHEFGTSLLLFCLVIASLLGALVTWAYRIETAGVNLEHI